MGCCRKFRCRQKSPISGTNYRTRRALHCAEATNEESQLIQSSGLQKKSSRQQRDRLSNQQPTTPSSRHHPHQNRRDQAHKIGALITGVRPHTVSRRVSKILRHAVGYTVQFIPSAATHLGTLTTVHLLARRTAHITLTPDENRQGAQ